MFAVRHQQDPSAPHAWQEPTVCEEFRSSGLELELIDAVDALERAEAVGRPETTALALRVRHLQDELVALFAPR